MIFIPAQPVHDELEYIKMRYKSPARSSFRDNKMYATLTTQSTAYSTMSRGVDGPNYSDDSTERGVGGYGVRTGTAGRGQVGQEGQYGRDRSGQELHVPWTPTSPPQTDISLAQQQQPEGLTQIPGTPPLQIRPAQPGGDGYNQSQTPSQGHGQPTYNIIGQTQGVTVI